MMKWLVGSIVLMIAIGFWFQYSGDEVLHPEITRWLNEAQSENGDERVFSQRNAFIYLLGIRSAKSVGSYQAGAEIVDYHLQARTDASFFQGFSMEPEVKQLSLPESSLLCEIARQDCLASVMGNWREIGALLAENALLLERYQMFLGMDFYKTLLVAQSGNFEPSYAAISLANRLTYLAAIEQLHTLGPQQFVTSMVDNIRRLRSMLASADSFRLKQTLLLAVVEDVRLLISLYNKGYQIEGLLDGRDEIFSGLGLLERSLEEDMKREFYVHAEAVRNFSHAELADDRMMPPDWATRFLLHPNRTLNDVFPRFKRNYDLSILSPKEFLAAVAVPFPASNVIARDNLVGSILNRGAVTNLEEFIGAFNDIDCFLKLVRIRLMLPLADELKEDSFADGAIDVANPYTGRMLILQPELGRICYSTRNANSVCIDF